MKTTNLSRLFVPALFALALTVTVSTASAEEKPAKEKTPHIKKADADKNVVVSEAEKAAAKAEREKKKAEMEAKMLEKYDVNKNGKLDPDEREKMVADRKDEGKKHKAEKAADKAK